MKFKGEFQGKEVTWRSFPTRQMPNLLPMRPISGQEGDQGQWGSLLGRGNGLPGGCCDEVVADLYLAAF